MSNSSSNIIIIIIFVIIFIIFISCCSSSIIGFIGYHFLGDDVKYKACNLQHKWSIGGVFGTESECSDPNGLNLPGCSPCPDGENKDCLSGHCNCSFPHSEGSTCYCTTTSNDVKLPDHTPCPCGDDSICQSHDCDCDFPNSTGDTCVCAPEDSSWWDTFWR